MTADPLETQLIDGFRMLDRRAQAAILASVNAYLIATTENS